MQSEEPNWEGHISSLGTETGSQNDSFVICSTLTKTYQITLKLLQLTVKCLANTLNLKVPKILHYRVKKTKIKSSPLMAYDT